MNNRINVKNLHYAKVTVDPATGAFTYDTPKLISNAMQVGFTPTIAEGTLYGDGSISDQISRLTGANISLQLNKMPIEDANIMLGKTKDANGITHDNVSNEAVQVAIGWEVELTGSKSEFIWILNCKAAPMQSEVQQSTDNINYSTDTITFTAMKDPQGDIKLFGETVDSDFLCANTWFASIPPVPPVTP
jgi:phi13 family phage major tail protein